MKRFCLLLSGVLLFVWGCTSAQVEKDLVDPNIAIVSAQNKQLANIPFSGFGYKSSKLPKQEWDQWAKAAAPIVREVLGKIPDNYALQVTGHADGSGPEDPVGNKPGNIKISRDRARTVYNALKRAGINSPKMTYKGVGSAELMDDIDARSSQQRRVTFKVVMKE